MLLDVWLDIVHLAVQKTWIDWERWLHPMAIRVIVSAQLILMNRASSVWLSHKTGIDRERWLPVDICVIMLQTTDADEI